MTWLGHLNGVAFLFVVYISEWQAGSDGKGEGLKARVCGRSGVRPLPPAYYFSNNLFPDPMRCLPNAHTICLKFITLRSINTRSNAPASNVHGGPPSLLHTESHARAIGLAGWALTNSAAYPSNWVHTSSGPLLSFSFLISLFYFV